MEYHVEKIAIEVLTRMPIETPGPVSYYKEIRPLMECLAKKYGHTLTYDRERTTYIRVEGEDTTKTVCIGAHPDTIGLMVRHINDNETLALCNLEGTNYDNIEGYSVQVYTWDGNMITGLFIRTPHSTHVSDDARSAAREESNMMVILDGLVRGSNKVRALGIRHRDIIPIDSDYRSTKSGFIKSRSIDNKAAVVVVFAVLEDLQKAGRKPRYTTLFAFPLCEEIGYGGAYLPQEIGEYVVLDISLIGPDCCGSEIKMNICAKDDYTSYDRILTTKLIHLAGDQKLDYGMDMFYHYSTDASATIRAGNDVYAAVFGMSCFAPHGMERCHIQSVVQTAKLSYTYLLSK